MQKNPAWSQKDFDVHSLIQSNVFLALTTYIYTSTLYLHSNMQEKRSDKYVNDFPSKNRNTNKEHASKNT